MNTILNISTYQFVTLNNIAQMREELRAVAHELQIKGSILLAAEGINMTIAGLPEAVRGFMAHLHSRPEFANLPAKESWTDYVPFKKMHLKLKKEIITMKMPMIVPQAYRAAAVSPADLNRWLDQGHDDNGREVVMMDTRNQFEVDFGTFANVEHYGIKTFSQFPEQIAQHKDALMDKTIVTFCTGGIRCEKAALHMNQIGLEHTYQLEGGILKYFEETDAKYWNGECFVFDDRIAIDKNLVETAQVVCQMCKTVLTRADKLSPQYKDRVCCPHCYVENYATPRRAHLTEKLAQKGRTLPKNAQMRQEVLSDAHA
jgi:UPF0176 protein